MKRRGAGAIVPLLVGLTTGLSILIPAVTARRLLLTLYPTQPT